MPTINERLEAAKAALVEAKDGEDATALQSAIDEFKAAEAAKKSADEADALIASLANPKEEKKMDQTIATPKSLGEFALKNLDLDAVKAGGRTRTPATFPVKAATDVHVVGQVAVQSETIVDPQPVLSVRDLFGAETISGNAITFYQMGATETAGQLPAGTVAENGAKPQFHVPYKPVTVPLSKVAGWFYETDELLADAPYLRSAIDNRGLFELRRAVESYLITTLANVDGIGSIEFTPTATPVEKANAILSAIAGVKNDTGYDADAIVIDPDTYYALRTATAGDSGQYYGGGFFYGPYGNGDVMRQPGLWGLPTFVSNMFAGVIVGAFRQGASVVTKAGEGASIEVHRGDHDDAIHNRVTVVVEERLALAVRVPAAFAMYQAS